MAYLCEEITVEQVCTKWVVYQESNHSFLPELTGAERDEMALWFFGIFVSVFTVRMIRKLFDI